MVRTEGPDPERDEAVHVNRRSSPRSARECDRGHRDITHGPGPGRGQRAGYGQHRPHHGAQLRGESSRTSSGGAYTWKAYTSLPAG
jgi:hypothetical protein